MRLVKQVLTDIFSAFVWLLLMLVSPLWLLHELIVERQMEKAHRDYLNSDYYKSLNHDMSVTCVKCGRLPAIWEEAFPLKICEGCYDIWLDEIWEKEHGATK